MFIIIFCSFIDLPGTMTLLQSLYYQQTDREREGDKHAGDQSGSHAAMQVT